MPIMAPTTWSLCSQDEAASTCLCCLRPPMTSSKGRKQSDSPHKANPWRGQQALGVATINSPVSSFPFCPFPCLMMVLGCPSQASPLSSSCWIDVESGRWGHVDVRKQTLSKSSQLHSKTEKIAEWWALMGAWRSPLLWLCDVSPCLSYKAALMAPKPRLQENLKLSGKLMVIRRCLWQGICHWFDLLLFVLRGLGPLIAWCRLCSLQKKGGYRLGFQEITHAHGWTEMQRLLSTE